MSEIKRKRLDTILLELGLVNEGQIREALSRQKLHGGKFGSSLMFYRYVSEESLVTALSLQYNRPGVMLGERALSPEVVAMIPSKVARARRAIAFDYDVEKNILRIAAADPDQANLLDELAFVARGKNVDLFVASEIAIETAIDTHYSGIKKTLEDNLILKIPSELTAIGPEEFSLDHAPGKSPVASRVVIVTDEEFGVSQLRAIIERSGAEVEIMRSVEQAKEALKLRFIEKILIRDLLVENKGKVEAEIRAFNFRTEVRWFTDCATLAVSGPHNAGATDTLKNLELLVTLLGAAYGERDSRAAFVGRTTARICDKLGLSKTARAVIASAGFLHNLSIYADRSREESPTRARAIHLTADLLESIGYEADIVAILRQTYGDMAGHSISGSLPQEALGANIVTIADMFSEALNGGEPFSLIKLEETKSLLFDLTGKLFLPEVVDAFVAMLQEECLNQELVATRGEVVIYHCDSVPLDPFVGYQLQSRGLRVTIADTPADLARVCSRRHPDALIVFSGDSLDPETVCHDIKIEGVDIAKSPTLVITHPRFLESIPRLRQLGALEVITDTSSYSVLYAKTLTLIERHKRSSASQEESSAGAQGRLAEINLIDLIQALGPSRKTVKIELHEEGVELVVYLREGSIVFAAISGGMAGPEAIFEGISWLKGAFTVRNIDPARIPPPNVDIPNESILMEGCRLIDEKLRSG